MSIKSDRWIRRMAFEHNMIEPFEAGQVRTADNGDRQGKYQGQRGVTLPKA